MTYRKIQRNSFCERLDATDPSVGSATSTRHAAVYELTGYPAKMMTIRDIQCFPYPVGIRSTICRQLSRITPCSWISKVLREGG